MTGAGGEATPSTGTWARRLPRLLSPWLCAVAGGALGCRLHPATGSADLVDEDHTVQVREVLSKDGWRGNQDTASHAVELPSGGVPVPPMVPNDWCAEPGQAKADWNAPFVGLGDDKDAAGATKGGYAQSLEQGIRLLVLWLTREV